MSKETLSPSTSEKRNSSGLNRISVGTQGKTALVLSAGGMFGAWQAGVWQALSPHFRPDMVVGASAGSLNGWLIASGCAADELAARWASLHGLAEIRWRVPASLSEGVLDPSRLEALIQDMCASAEPRIRFGVVLTDLLRLQPALFEYPDLTWRHIAASCAVPLFLRHHRIDGRWYSDGGVLDPLPVRAAVAMGATRIIGLNCLKSRPTWVTKSVSTMRRMAKCQRPDMEPLDFIEIGPGQTLGSARDCMYWTEANAERWLALGRSDGEAALQSVVECGNRVRPDGGPAESDEGCTHTVSTV